MLARKEYFNDLSTISSTIPKRYAFKLVEGMRRGCTSAVDAPSSSATIASSNDEYTEGVNTHIGNSMKIGHISVSSFEKDKENVLPSRE